MQIRTLTTGSIVAYTLLAITVSLLVGVAFGDISLGFDESNVATLASVILLSLTAFTSFRIHKIRTPQIDGSWRDPAHIWAIIGAGFVFLALDDGLRLHEQMDNWFHRLSDREESAYTDRIDDLIILAYGLVGLAVLYAYRSEIIRVKGFVTLLAIGFVLFFLQVGIDAVTNRDEYLTILEVPREHFRTTREWMQVLEESVKLIAEAFFLAGFIHVLRHDSAVSDAPENDQ